MLRLLQVFSVFFLCFSSLYAQTTPLWRFGVSAQAGFTLFNASFNELPGIPKPPALFTSGNGFGWAAGAWADIPVYSSFRGGLRTDYRSFGGDLTTDEPPVSTAAGSLTFRHTLRTDFTSFGLEPFLEIQPIDAFSVALGFRLGFLTKNTFTQIQTIVEPGIEYINGGRTLQRGAGVLPSAAALETSVSARVGYNLPVSSSFFLRPEVMYSQGISNLVDNIDWKTSAIRAGLSLLFVPSVTAPPVIIMIDTVYRRDTTVQIIAGLKEENLLLSSQSMEEQQESVQRRARIITEHYVRSVPRPPSALSADISVKFVLDDGRETKGVKVVVEEVLQKSYIPLLPYIFFDWNSARIPSRYARSDSSGWESFTTERLRASGSLEVYHHLMDIVGKRLADRPHARLTITGYHAEDENAQEISHARAEGVKLYLSTIWHIKPDRLIVQAGELPLRPSASSQTGGNEENRRVELFSDDYEILAPIVVQDTLRTANPPMIRFHPDVFSEAGVREWAITVSQQGRILKTLQGTEVPEFIDWDINAEKSILVLARQPMDYAFTVTDREDQRESASPGTITFEQTVKAISPTSKQVSKHVQRYSLIFFDYNTAELSSFHQNLLKKIRSTLPPKGQVSVIGTTDISGDEEHNKQLSVRRARTVADALAIPNTQVSGLGRDALTYPNDLPEGRFYSRRVDIIIQDTH